MNEGRTRDEWAELEAALEETQRQLDAMTDNFNEADQRADLWESKADMYRKQLGGTNAALHRARQEARELRDENKRLLALGIDYRNRCEACESAFRKLTGNPLEQLDELLEGRAS